MSEMSISEAATALGVSPETIRRRARRGELPARKDDRGRYRVLLDGGLPPPPPGGVGREGALTAQATEIARLRVELDEALREIAHRDELLGETRQRATRAERESDRLAKQLAAATVRELQLLTYEDMVAIGQGPATSGTVGDGNPSTNGHAPEAAESEEKRGHWWAPWRRS
jgi:excisionase family DNA binding protein